MRFGQGWRDQHRDGDDERGEALGAAVIVVLVGIEGGTFVLLYLPCLGKDPIKSGYRLPPCDSNTR